VALTQQFASGEDLTAAKLNASSIPVVSSTADITTPFTGQIVFNTTDTRLYRYTGSAWRKFSGGPVWSLERNTTQSIPNNAYTDVVWNGERTDTDGVHAASSTDVVITQDGLYTISPSATFVNNATGVRAIQLLQNGTVLRNVGVPATSGFGTTVQTPTLYVQCVVVDVLKVQVYQNSGGALNLAAATVGDYSLFNGAWLRD
jgi:hypothetical protein